MTSPHTGLPQPDALYPYHQPDLHPEPAWPRWLRMAIIPVLWWATSFVVGLAMAQVLRMARHSDMAMPAALLLQIIAMPALVVAVVWALMRLIDRRPLRETGLTVTSSSLAWLLLGAVIAVLIMPSVALLWQVRSGAGARSFVPTTWDFTVLNVASTLFASAVPAALLFIGYGLQVMRDRPRAGAVVVAALHTVVAVLASFALPHQPVFQAVVVPFCMTLAAASLALATRSLWAAVGLLTGHTIGWWLAFSLRPLPAPRVLTLGTAVVHLVVAAICLSRVTVDEGAAPLNR